MIDFASSIERKGKMTWHGRGVGTGQLQGDAWQMRMWSPGMGVGGLSVDGFVHVWLRFERTS